MQNVVRLVTTMETQDDIGFSDFWALYPKRVAKKDAEKAWNRIELAEHIPIIEALAAWGRVWSDKGDPQFVPHPATWLNGERWTDELPKGYSLRPRATPAKQEPEKPGEFVGMPDHVRAILDKIRGKQ